jgi:hypothetical protein
MNYAVLMYSHADNPKSIPETWIAEVIPLIKRIKNSSPPEGTPLSEIVNWPEFIDVAVSFPEGEGWLLMSEEDLEAYRQANLPEYLIWESANSEGIPLNENYKVQEYTEGLLSSTKFYQDVDNGTYINLAKEINNHYIEGTTSLKKIVQVTYNSKGIVTGTRTTKFFTDTETNKVITIVEEE